MVIERFCFVKGLWCYVYCLNCYCFESYELFFGSLRGLLLCCVMLCYVIFSFGEEFEVLGFFVWIVYLYVVCFE